MTAHHVPLSTYRLQLHGGFPFEAARQLVPYLERLGITDCYCSPPFAARPGSTHGYDVTNHNALNPELGGREAFEALARELAQRGLGLILDFVPNHMGNDSRTNEWWRDVLENGPGSTFARVFDIDWDPVKPELKNRLLLPILGEHYGDALEQGQLHLAFDHGTLVLCYHDHRLPVTPRSLPIVLETAVDGLTAELGEDDPHVREFLSILTALRNLPPYVIRDEHRRAEGHREKEVARERLARLVTESAAVSQHVDAAVRAFNGQAGVPDSFDGLHGLLEQQPYRLAYWRAAADEINYRRFFDVNDLAGLRVEDDRVFDHIHQLVLELAGQGLITGLRLDHVDGLAAPRAYLHRLQAAVQAARGTSGLPFYIVVEKILTGDETLPGNWPVSGTTGYNFLNEVNGLFVDQRHRRRLQRTLAAVTGQPASLDEIVYESKRLIVGTAMSSELQVLTAAVNRLSERHRRTRDFTLGGIRRALREVVACFPVYRTYVTADGVSAEDRTAVATAIATARERNPATEPSIFAFLETVLLPEPAAPGHPELELPYHERLDVALKFQQYTAPVQAKGVEDTAFYRYNLLLSLNEVGGHPDSFGHRVDSFHAANRHRQRYWPHEMLATSTHDTKRGEDARARLNVLSEWPRPWREGVTAWMRLNAPVRTKVNNVPAPDRSDEYHFYQALLAAWPPDLPGAPLPLTAPADVLDRLSEYMLKAIREAKHHTSWVNPNTAYEDAMRRFVHDVLAGSRAVPFLASFVPFARRVARAGAVNSLSQLVLKHTSPGVPDTYQGTELWDLSLVDPDNRRPVDYAQRSAWLDDMEPVLEAVAAGQSDASTAARISDWTDQWPDGRIKLFFTAAGLRARKRFGSLFLSGRYENLLVEGSLHGHIVAFARSLDEQTIVTVVPRLSAHLLTEDTGLRLSPEAWLDTRVRLPEGTAGSAWRHLYTGQTLEPLRGERADWLLISQLLEATTAAVLVRAG